MTWRQTKTAENFQKGGGFSLFPKWNRKECRSKSRSCWFQGFQKWRPAEQRLFHPPKQLVDLSLSSCRFSLARTCRFSWNFGYLSPVWLLGSCRKRMEFWKFGTVVLGFGRTRNSCLIYLWIFLSLMDLSSEFRYLSSVRSLGKCWENKKKKILEIWNCSLWVWDNRKPCQLNLYFWSLMDLCCKFYCLLSVSLLRK